MIRTETVASLLVAGLVGVGAAGWLAGPLATSATSATVAAIGTTATTDGTAASDGTGADITTGIDPAAASPAPDASAGTPADPASIVPPEPPACRYADLSAVVDAEAPHLTFLDTAVALKRAYVPTDLVPLARAQLPGNGLIRQAVVPDLRAMVRAARAAGIRLASVSAYRSYRMQIGTYRTWSSMVGPDRVRLYSARPGHSEHQLGTTIDFGALGGPSPWSYRDWARTPAGAWMAAHGWEYGFVMTYPRSGSPAASCYAYEPWHWRWVGRDAAREIREAGVVPRVWFWRREAAQR